MIKTFHGRTNYRRLIKLLSYKPKTYVHMGEKMTITPLGSCNFRVQFRNDTIDFYVSVPNKAVYPTRMVNIIEDIDQTTFVTGTKIQKRNVMVQADERLYRVCQNYIFEFGKEII